MLGSLAVLLLGAVLLVGCGSNDYDPGPLANSTACGVLTADQAGQDSADIDAYVQAANPYLAGLSPEAQGIAVADVLPVLLGECQAHPDELLSAAYSNAQSASLATTDTDTPDPSPDAYDVTDTTQNAAGCVFIGGNPDLSDAYCTPSSTP
jgi:hypothetical protein